MARPRPTRSNATTRPGAPARRRFLKGATAATGAAAIAGIAGCGRSEQPAVPGDGGTSSAAPQQQVSLRMQSGTPAGDFFFRLSQDYARIVKDLTNGGVSIEVLPSGAVVKAFDAADAVHKGTLDIAHAVPAFWYSKNSALSLFGTGPALGYDANTLLSWYEHGGGKALYEELYRDVLKLDVVPILMGPMGTQPLGWFKKEVKGPEDFQGLKFRTVGLSVDVFTAMGASVVSMPGSDVVPALDRGLIDAAEFNNPAVDGQLGLPDASKICMVQSYHQPAECFEILINRKLYDSLPENYRKAFHYAGKVAAAEMTWHIMDAYSKAYVDLRDNKKVNFIKTPDSVLKAQLEAWDKVIQQKGAENPFFTKVLDSQKEYMKRVVGYQIRFEVSPQLAYEHFFGKA
jgi:TRAP-type mannitol/chloroaromatic compound transport system substrate-binding protein